MFGYKLFISLSLLEVEQRREALDHAGFIGWLSPIIILFFIWATRVITARLSLTAPQTKDKPPNTVTALIRQASWLLSTPLQTDFGDLRTDVFGACYASWLLCLAARNTSPDYMHLTKAFGHVAVSQLPIHFLLSIKSPRSPIQAATGLSHERLNAYHRLSGRILHLLLSTHAILYLNFFYQAGVLGKRIKSSDVRLGLAAFTALNLLAGLALPVVRRKAYHSLFARSHSVLALTLLALLFFHVRYTRVYVAQAFVFALANALARTASTSNPVTAQLETVSSTSLIRLSAQIPSTSALNDFLPGEHVYIKDADAPLGSRNPFTIVSVEGTSTSGSRPSSTRHKQSTLSLVIRNVHGPQTASLTHAATHPGLARFNIEGPYGEAREYMPALLSSDRFPREAGDALIVAGGVGATYALPIYIALCKSWKHSTRLRFVWVVRSAAEVSWATESLARVKQPMEVDVHVTEREARWDAAAKDMQNIGGVSVRFSEGRPEIKDIVHGWNLEGSSKTDRSRGVVSSGKKSPRALQARREYSPLTVLMCGPPGLARDVREEIGKDVMSYGRDVRYHEEQFGFGAS